MRQFAPLHKVQADPVPILRITAWDILTGIPAGMLIFMATVLFSTLIGFSFKTTELVPVAILAIVCLKVGLLAGVTRLKRGPATALSAGTIASGILGYLWLAARPGDEVNHLVIGPLGIIIALTISPIGGWLGAKLRKAL